MASMIRDDRGCRVAVCCWEALPPEAEARLSSGLREKMERAASVYKAAVTLVCGLAAVGVLTFLGVTYSFWMAVVGGVPLGVVAGLLVRYWVPGDTAECWRRDLLEARLCASCGYSLSEIGPSPDGCRVCSECGSAWRIGRAS